MEKMDKMATYKSKRPEESKPADTKILEAQTPKL